MELVGPEDRDRLPAQLAVRDLYVAAAAQPPLNEPEDVGVAFAGVYASAVAREPVYAVADHDGPRLAAFAYGYPWRWAEQRYPWSDELERRLGQRAHLLEGTHALLLLARHPSLQGTGRGRRVLDAWLELIGGGPAWLQTTDVASPARRLYEASGFEAIGHGPNAPDGRPGLVMFRA